MAGFSFPWGAPASSVAEVVVHILDRGRALCPLKGIPRDWPQGHKWLSIADIEAGVESNCKDCIAGYRTKRGLR